MKKNYLVEIDDYFPLEPLNGISFLPIEDGKHTIWSLLIAKAILKLYQNKFKFYYDKEYLENHEIELYNGDIIYSLTGMHTYSIDLSKGEQFDWKYLKYIASDDNYFENLFKLSSIKLKYSKVPGIDNFSKIRSETGIECENGAQGTMIKRTQTFKSQYDFVKKIMENNKRYQRNLLTGFLYGINDVFENDNLNMQNVKQISEEEIILRKRYADLIMTRTQFMNKDDIIKLKKARRDLRMRIKDLESATREKMNKINTKTKLIGINSGLFARDKLNVNSRYTDKEIQIAKTCLLNKLDAPPNYFNFNEIKIEEGSVISGSLNTSFFKNLEQALRDKIKSLSDFGELENAKYPKKRPTSAWVDLMNFFNSFNIMNVHYNPVHFKYIEVIENTHNSDISVIDPKKEVLIVYRHENPSETRCDNFYINFQVDSAISRSSLVLQKYDFEKFQSIKSFYPVKSTNSSMKLPVTSENQVYRLSLYSPHINIIDILSKTYFDTMSISDYLKSIESWKETVFKVHGQSLTRKDSHVIAKFIIKSDRKQNIVIGCNYDRYIGNHTVFRLSKIDDQQIEGSEDYEFITKNIKSHNFYIETYGNIEIEQATYILAVECNFSENIKDVSFDMEFLSKFEPEISLLDSYATDDYIDKAKIQYDGNITRELVIFNGLTAHISFEFTLKQHATGLDLADSKKNTQLKELDTSSLFEFEPYHFVFFDFYLNSKKIFTLSGVRGLKVTNMLLKKDSEDDEISFRVRIEPSNIKELRDEIYSRKVFWIFRVRSDQNLAIVRDQRLQEEDNLMISSWEKKAPGRSELAKKIKKEYIDKLTRTKEKNDEPKENSDINQLIE